MVIYLRILGVVVAVCGVVTAIILYTTVELKTIAQGNDFLAAMLGSKALNASFDNFKLMLSVIIATGCLTLGSISIGVAETLKNIIRLREKNPQ